MSAGLPLVPDLPSEDPSWATVYVPEAGRHWREWHEPTMRGMMHDLGFRHPGWTPRWWIYLRDKSVRSCDERTWTAVYVQHLRDDVHPSVQFCSWEHSDAQQRKVNGAPLRIAAYPGIWHKGAMFTFACVWQTYREWTQPKALERVWRDTAGAAFPAHHLLGPGYQGLRPMVDDAMRQLREGLEWTVRSKMLAAMLNDPWPNPYLREINAGAGMEWDQSMAWEAAEAQCWQEAEDDLPWPDLAPRREAGSIRPGRGPAPPAAPAGQPRAVPLFDLADRP